MQNPRWVRPPPNYSKHSTFQRDPLKRQLLFPGGPLVGERPLTRSKPSVVQITSVKPFQNETATLRIRFPIGSSSVAAK